MCEEYLNRLELIGLSSIKKKSEQVTSSTHRYGDRAPTTVQGRIFSIVWTLYGLVITGILVGNLTSSLTASVAFSLNEVNLYKAKVSYYSISEVKCLT
jgi:hypothetical protein